ncbi:MAG: WbqC family protein [bacterium]|nr:WbqC family protein [bacterium]
MKKKLAIVQSFYIPWKGYFDRINLADEVILYDDMQYVKRFWINRNRIKTAGGVIWLTVPVSVKGRFTQAIKDTQISDPAWTMRHWETIERSYGRAAHFQDFRELFKQLFLEYEDLTISKINFRFIAAICDLLGIKTQFSWSMDYPLVQGKTDRLVDLCLKRGAGIYISGPTAKEYLREELFKEAGIEVQYMDYSDYPEYDQLYPPFVHEVSILDLLFNTGMKAGKYLKSFSTNT